MDSKDRMDIANGTIFVVFTVGASTGEVWGVSVTTGSDVRIDFLEQQDPIGSILWIQIQMRKEKMILLQFSRLT